MKRNLIIGVAMVVSCTILLGGQAPAADADPFDGTWRLNVAKSTYRSAPPPAAGAIDVRRLWTMDDGWKVFMLSGVNQQGEPTIQISTYKVDGRQYPVYNAATMAAHLASGTPTTVTRSYRRIDPLTMEFTTYTDGVAGLPGRRTVSKDGKTYTQTIRSRNAAGELVDNVSVFDRVR